MKKVLFAIVVLIASFGALHADPTNNIVLTQNDWSAGGVIIGAVMSTTPIRKLALVLLAALIVLVAVQKTVVVPSGKRLPEAGAHEGAIGFASVSAADTEYVTYAPAELVA